ncbi:MAG: hypothetical protein ACKOA8_11215 [Deltaproteobacteria bacterium]
MKKSLKILFSIGILSLPLFWWFSFRAQSNSNPKLDSQQVDFSDVDESGADESKFQQEKKETTRLTPRGQEQSSASSSSQNDIPPSPPMSEEEKESLTTMNFIEETMRLQDETDIWEWPDTTVE